MKGRMETERVSVSWQVTMVGAISVALGACSPVDLTDSGTDTKGEDAAVSQAGGQTSAPEPRPTNETPGKTSKPEGTTSRVTTSAPEPVTVTEASQSSALLTEGETQPSLSSGPVEGPSMDAGVTSDVPPPVIDPACLMSAVEPIPPGLFGFAAIQGYGVGQTTGGQGGDIVYVASEQALRDNLESVEPRVVVVCGEIALTSRLRIGSNKTLVGIGPSSILRGGIDVHGTADAYVGNVIIANLTVDSSSLPVATQSENGIWLEFAHHVWLDHLEVYDAPYGLVDVLKGSDLVTLSWNKFHFTPDTPDAEHRFGVRIGDANDATVFDRDAGKLRVTLHHNWFGEYIRQRIPRVALGQVHIFNNYYSVTSNDTTIWGLSEYAEVLVQSNYFERTHNPHDVPTDVPNDGLANIVARGNVYYATTGQRETQGEVFDPPYEHHVDSTVWLPSLIPWGAGPHATFDPAPPWSDAGVAPPGADGGVDAATPTSTESSLDASSPSDAASSPNDASLGGGSATRD